MMVGSKGYLLSNMAILDIYVELEAVMGLLFLGTIRMMVGNDLSVFFGHSSSRTF